MSTNLNEWHAKLALSFSRQGPHKTILSDCRHEGPLLVQKALYPEGPAVCHVTVLHPPSGIAGGDILSIDIKLHEGAHAVLCTPGATRWYKSNGRHSEQQVHIRLGANTRLDWLPQENIFFEQVNASTRTHLHMQSGASVIGWEITQLGSISKSTHWDEGRILFDTCLSLDGTPMWLDTGQLNADSPLRHSGNGLAGFPVMATLWAFGAGLSGEHVEGLARNLPWTHNVRAGITYLPQRNAQGLSLLRVLGTHVQDVKRVLIEWWMHLRPLILGTQGALLRLWST